MGPRASQEQVGGPEGARWGSTSRSSNNTRTSSSGFRAATSAFPSSPSGPVNDDIAETFAATFELVLATIVIAFVCRRAAGRRRGGEQGRRGSTISCGLSRSLGAVTPSFLLALLLQVLAGYVLHVSADDRALHRPTRRSRADITGLLTIDTSAERQSRRAFRRAAASVAAEPCPFRRHRRADRAHHALLDDRRRQAGLHRGSPRLRRARPRAAVQIHAAARLRAADDDPRPGICFAARQRLRRRACVRLAGHGELRRAQHSAEGPQRGHGRRDDFGRLLRRRQSRRSTCSSASSIRASASEERGA